MSELGSSAAVEIESVEWLDAGAGNLTVRVTGRWRRRRGWGRSEVRSPAVLVVEADGRRHRFPAMPEPPTLAGVGPGRWRLSFSVPGELAPRLGGHAQLTLGTVTVPLPVPQSATEVTEETSVAEPGPGERGVAPAEMGEAEAPPPGAPASREPGDAAVDEPIPGESASLEIERAWRRADDAERRADAAEAQRHELERRLVQRAQETDRADRALRELADAQEAIRGLQASLQQARRDGDEAARSVAAAEAAREQAEQRLGLAVSSATAAPAAEAERLRAEATLRAARQSDGPPRVPAEPPATVPGRDESPRQGGAGLPEPDLVAALRRELGTRVSAEASLRARLIAAETRLATRVLLEQRTTATLRELRAELHQLRGALEDERGARRQAEDDAARARAELGGRRERSHDVSEAIGEIRGALDDLRVPAPRPEAPMGATGRDPSAPDPAGAVAPERLSDALARLREAQEPRDVEADAAAPTPAVAAAPATSRARAPLTVASAHRPAPGGVRAPGAPTLERAFRRLAGRDADRAGRLLLDLLGAQRAAYPHPVAYDLVLGPGRGCVQVTVGEGEPEIVRSGAARAREQVDFQVVGDPARLARRLLAGGLGRLLWFRVARVRGHRAGFAALRSLLSLPLDIAALSADGMRVEVETLLSLVAAMIEPAWTRGERFTVACRDDAGATAYLQIRDGAAPVVTGAGQPAPAGRVAVALGGSASRLTRTIAGQLDGAELSGDGGAFAMLREWIERAQSG